MAFSGSVKDMLRRLVPMDGLSEESLDKLAGKLAVQKVPAGKALFKRGDRDKTAIYLLSGEVRLVGADGAVKTVLAGSPEALHPLGGQPPRLATAMSAGEIGIVRVDTELLDILLTWDQSAGYVVEEISPEAELADDADWMTRMLRSNIFYKVPPANIHAILTRMEPVRARAGELIVEQGGEGDYFYIVKSGVAEVIHTDATGRSTRLAERRVGDGFGEESLMSSGKRNASVRMVGDGELMRLSKQDFDQLLKAPLLRAIGRDEAQARVDRGEAAWIDVRLESEYRNSHLPAALNTPLYLLRVQSRRLPSDRALVVYCDTGRRSSAAAYLLSERGFDVYVLEGGYQAAQAA